MRVNNLKKIRQIDTPFYLYDKIIIENNIATLLKNFSTRNTKIFFAVKANTSISILKIIRKKNIGAEVVSPGEVFICLKAGFSPRKILYNNIARKENDVIYAIKKGIIFFNFEAIDQALLLEKCASKLRKKIKIFARINPAIFPDTHPHLSTGAPSSKFGIEISKLYEVVCLIKRLKYAEFVGIHSHIGSQILSPSPFVKGAYKVMKLINYFKRHRIKVSHVNLGGGFGIPYHPCEHNLDFNPIVKAYKKIEREYKVKVFLEPGRFIVGNAGYIVTRIISVKKRNRMTLYVIDAGMTENPRPALYQAYHHIDTFYSRSGKRKKTRVTGPLCENSDEFGIYKLPELKIGEGILIHNCGAYARTMASNYNGRLLPAEFIVNKKGVNIIREKQKFESLIDNEKH